MQCGTFTSRHILKTKLCNDITTLLLAVTLPAPYSMLKASNTM